MNKNNARDYLPLVQALADGKSLQYNVNRSDEAPELVDLEDFTFDEHFTGYRIKPDPREIWVNHYQDAAYRDNGPYASKEQAALMAARGAVQKCYREVIE